VEKFARRGAGSEAGSLVREMQGWFGVVRRSTLAIALSAMVRGGDARGAAQLLGEAWGWVEEESNVEKRDVARPDERLCAMVANAAVEERRLDLAHRIVAQMQENGVRPGNFSFTVLMKAYGRAKRLSAVFKLVDCCLDPVAVSEPPDMVLMNAVVDAFIRCGEIQEARKVIGRFADIWGIKPNIRTYNTLLKGYGQSGMLTEAFQMRTEIADAGLEPDEVTRNTLVSACVAMGQFDSAKSLIDEIGDRLPVEAGSIFAFTSMVHGLAMRGRIDEAFTYVNHLEKSGIPANVVTYTALVTSYLHVGEVAKAWFLFRGMRKVNLTPDAKAYRAMISGLVKRGDLRSMDAVQSLLDEMRSKGMELEEETYNMLIDGFVRFGDMEAAESVFRELDQKIGPSVVSYTTLLRGYGMKQDMVSAKRIFQDLRARNIKPDRISLNTFLSACVRSGDLALARRVFLEMERMGGKVSPDVVSFGALTLGYAKEGDYGRAWSCYSEMKLRGIQPSPLLLNRLFKYCTNGLLPIENGYEIVEDMKAIGISDDEMNEKKVELKPLLMIASEVWKRADIISRLSQEDEFLQRHGWNEIDSSFRPF